jgi:alpha-L-fucosidase
MAAPQGKPGASTGGIRPKRFGDGRDWFFQKRYGMFVHWGIYSIPGWHEQHQWRFRVPRAEYVQLAGSGIPSTSIPMPGSI